MKTVRSALGLLATMLLLAGSTLSTAQVKDNLEGITSAKAVFDVRVGNPKAAAIHLNLIHETYRDLAAAGKEPDVRVVFSGPIVKLLSNDTGGFAEEDKTHIEAVANAVKALAKDGIGMEICLVAVNFFGVDPASVLPGIDHVKNGWISIIGYHSQGYALVPTY